MLGSVYASAGSNLREGDRGLVNWVDVVMRRGDEVELTVQSSDPLKLLPRSRRVPCRNLGCPGHVRDSGYTVEQKLQRYV